jgi:hypothetical protein
MNAWKLPKFSGRAWARLNQIHRVASSASVVPETGALRYGTTLQTQAARIIAKFGGVRDLMRALNAVGRPRNAASIYKWTYAYPRGTGGLIPASAWDDIYTAARHEGILLGPSDTHVYADSSVPEAFELPDPNSALGKRRWRAVQQTPQPIAVQRELAKDDRRQRARRRYLNSAKGQAAVKRQSAARQARIVAAKKVAKRKASSGRK